MLLSLFRLIARLPLGWIHAIGAVLGLVAYAASQTYRGRLRENLAQAGFDPRTHAHQAAREAGKQALETAWVWLRPAEALRRVVQVEDDDVERSAIASGRPLLYLTPHLGCFEITAQHVALAHWHGPRSLTVLYRIPKKHVLRPLVEYGRTRHGVELAPANLSGVRTLLRALKRGQAVGILPDQVPSQGDGVWAPFFGRPAYTMTLPGKLAAATGATVLLIFAERAGDLPGVGAGYRIRFRALSEALTGDVEHDARCVNRDLEAMIRSCPMQYLWGYNRYKVPAGVAPPPAQEGR